MEEVIIFIIDIISWPFEFLGQFPLFCDILSAIVGIGVLWAFGALFYLTVAPRKKADRFRDWLEARKK